MTETNANPKYKDSLFRFIFKERKELLSLFNAVNGTNYDNPDDLEINTLENAIYMSMKNDVSCVLDMRMELYEHQSTINPNMPLRDLFYVSKLYEKYIARKNKDIYSRTLIKLPAPKFIVLYNGVDEQPERKVMMLSDAFSVDTGEINLELKVLQLNINPGCNEELKKNCPTLFEYVCYVSKVRKYHLEQKMNLEDAVDLAISECINEGILVDILTNFRSEVKAMSIYEYDVQLHEKTLVEYGMERGIERGMERGMERGIEQEKIQVIRSLLKENQTVEFISKIVAMPIEYICEIRDSMPSVVCEESQYGKNDE